MKKNYIIKEITKQEALEMVKEFHYSNSLPHLNKHFLGFYLKDELVGIVTLGWGTRPLHTIKKVFPSLESKDYYEIGRMCMTEEMERNSESQMLSQLMKYIRKNLPEVKVVFTWADGILGKVGYVYQASNFLYAGFSETEMYLMNGVRIHPRETKQLFGLEGDKRLSVRPTLAQMIEHNIKHYKGKQFRYIYFLCDKKEKKRLLDERLVYLGLNYPKEKDLTWKVKNDLGKWIKCEMPEYKTDENKRRYQHHKKKGKGDLV